jgi:hypothetical protein
MQPIDSSVDVGDTASSSVSSPLDALPSINGSRSSVSRPPPLRRAMTEMTLNHSSSSIAKRVSSPMNEIRFGRDRSGLDIELHQKVQ